MENGASRREQRERLNLMHREHTYQVNYGCCLAAVLENDRVWFSFRAFEGKGLVGLAW